MKATAFVIAALILMPSAWGAAGPDPPKACITIATDLREIRESGARIEAQIYNGAAAQRMIGVLEELGAPEPMIFGRAKSFLLLIGPPEFEPPAIIEMFGEDGCIFAQLHTDRTTARRVLEKMGLPL